jgi:hypothetical protein
MPHTPDNLADDLAYHNLIDEGMRIVTSVGGNWTNHNAADPGITLLELFAYFAEALSFQAAQLTVEELPGIATLLDPDGDRDATADGASRLRESLQRALRPERVVSCRDFEAAAMAAGGTRIAFAQCVARRDLTSPTLSARQVERPGHVSVLVIPTHADHGDELCEIVAKYLEPRRLLGTRVHVGQPIPVEFGIRLTVVLHAATDMAKSRSAVINKLLDMFDPVNDGQRADGPIGRSFPVSELYLAIAGVPGVDYVTRTLDPKNGSPLEEIVVENPTARLDRNAAGDVVALRVDAHEIARPSVTPELISFRVADSTTRDTYEPAT